ncbi:MAG: hypothetical protein MUE53_00925 [Chitinophagales bacterium]|jgi:hypothetical protein|nr:hypothetical protein [Chitinophagales bacterium]
MSDKLLYFRLIANIIAIALLSTFIEQFETFHYILLAGLTASTIFTLYRIYKHRAGE